MSENFLSQYVDVLANPIAWFYNLFLPNDFSHRLAVVTVIFLVIGILFFFIWSINRFRQRNEDWVNGIIQKIQAEIDQENEAMLNWQNEQPIVSDLETVRIPFFYTRQSLGLSKEKSAILKKQGINSLDIATIKINKLCDIIHLGHIFADQLDELRYLIVFLAENRFIEPMMSRSEIVEQITNKKLQIHFICHDKLAIKELREKYKISNTSLPFPGTALFLRQDDKDDFFLKKVFYPSALL